MNVVWSTAASSTSSALAERRARFCALCSTAGDILWSFFVRPGHTGPTRAGAGRCNDRGQYTSLAQNLVQNPGFETGDFSGYTVTTGANRSAFVDTDTPHSGSFVAELGQIGSEAQLSQTLATTMGQRYNISFFAFNPSPAGINDLRFVFGGVQVFGAPITNTVYQQFMTTGIATSNSTLLQIFGRNDPAFTHLDDISVTAAAVTTTPEPSSIALLGTGLVGLVPMIRRRRKS